MDFRRLLTIAPAAAMVLLIIVGLLHFDLFFWLVTRILVVAVPVCAAVMLVRSLFPGE